MQRPWGHEAAVSEPLPSPGPRAPQSRETREIRRPGMPEGVGRE